MNRSQRIRLFQSAFGYALIPWEPGVIREQNRLHDSASPFLIGNYAEGDIVHDVPQVSWVDHQEYFL